MGSKTGAIKYNVKERGRKYRGQNRNFDTVALAQLINGGDVQERVKHRDMLGYFGHWPRIRFGMNPTEGAIVDGKVVALEPAIVTTKLNALPDGTIEHETEFLDTAAGRLAEKLYASKAGGFSSAIDTKRCGDKQVPIGFYGFDYVLEPNYTTNRGYQVALDGITDERQLAILDDVAEYQAMFDGLNTLYDSLQSAYDRQAETLLRIQLENEQLMSMLAKMGPVEVALDGIAAEAFGGGEGRIRAGDSFIDAALPGLEPLPVDGGDQPRKATDGLINRMFRMKG
jgi:hypothetical protein